MNKCRIGDACQVGDGAHAKIKRKSNGIIYLTSKNFKKEGIDLTKVDYISEKDYSKYFREDSKALTMPKVGDIVFSIIGTIGQPYLVEKKDKFGLSSSVAILRPDKNKLNPEYLFYWIKSPTVQNTLYSIKGGVAQSYLSLEMIKSLPLVYESKDIQNKLTFILSRYDQLIKNNEERIQLLEKMAKLIYDEWFVKFKFPGHENIKMVDSELGKIPDGWEVKGISDVESFNFISENIKQFGGEKEYFATANIDVINIIKEGIMYSYKEKPCRAQKQPTIYSVWFARMKDTHKVLGFTESNEFIANNSILSSGFGGFKSEKDIFPFLYYSINRVYFHKEKDRFATGATQVSLNNDGLSKIKILVPSKEVIESFGDKVLPILNEIFIFQIKNKTLSKTRDLLLPKLISGQVDISDLAINVPKVPEVEV